MKKPFFSPNEFMQPVEEKAFLVGVDFPSEPIPLEISLGELGELARTAGAMIVGSLVQKRAKVDPKYFIGTGKLEELTTAVAGSGANLVIFDHELSPSQENHLAEALGVKVIDRTALILDIFAQHAKSREGKLQVELAQATFGLTHLVGQGETMSRLGGGIGTRGPGESKLEYDRREIRSKIAELKKRIVKLRAERQRNREKRRGSQLPTVALVGYTNSGKSTLLNALTRSDVLTEDKLFATLDPTTRRLYLPSARTVLLTDTVGFIQKLPHSLVTAFQATLEEVTEADLLIHVVDSSSPYFEKQISAVYQVLRELKSHDKPILTVFNKEDKLATPISEDLKNKFEPSVQASASRKTGLEQLIAKLDALLPKLPPSIPASES
ncbi:GTPase HflX [candidate division WOR-1 bacterium RIFOXYA12_FULL_52_29]|uniref:GTPase HflX n=1 Tax=candidate division WOR-1 bacterium RIFOXYC12_FULL_54_18 TaxID=1802584 RepID=A0A1F4T3Z1_UNCSA|nr:MAG: GTPase HflX [candidate division WOR-1 bacterium RIFOXYA2_FULL_51_19]OGC17007.1 MAG: GTPase HflX [candidate division WOR-1 bacterium RIFOXYA12_FULL_52_29]OGC25868.1 MAG: GTPase HflX [candidate division WOR-1 bacterium RIFOXYB2_FULL_45_9]OGC27424.1 MAG: GTPase HflX [candidate division WOR-1 bacterium RIFOXYC12_FULL_54_18]OGC29363.1 MAG: GTPase HflX [candidate division WOR-1 bacterium RIFOXYB12_FULL_52_16]